MSGNFPSFGKISVDPTWKIAVITSVWHPECTEALRDDCSTALIASGISKNNMIIIDAPGSYELPLLCQKAFESGCDGVIAFGVVVQGETHHAALVAEQAAAGCMQVQLALGKPVVFEVIFVETIDVALARSIGKNGKGTLAAETLLTQLAKIRELRS